jgi:dynein heavy chain
MSHRYNYVTPTSYLELLSTFLKLLAKKRTEVTTAKKRLESGLDKLTSTANQVEDMQKELQELQPVLAATAKEVEDMMVVIAHDKEEAAQTKRTVEQQEREANEQAAVAKSIAGEAEPTQYVAQPFGVATWPRSALCITANHTCLVFAANPPPQRHPRS